MARSLQRHLSLVLGATILATGLAAAAVAFVFAYLEAEEFQDDALRQMAALALRTNAAVYDSEARLLDPESRVLIVHLPGEARPGWLPEDLAPGFHTIASGTEEWRVFVRADGASSRIAVAQSTDGRDELARDSALRTLAPLLLLLPVLVWLSVRIVRRELAPVRRLATLVDAQPAERPSPLPEQAGPEEIAPFLRAINGLMERVARLMGEQRRFVADAAHELRSPLQALSLQAQNLENAGSREDLRSRVALLRGGIERARRLTEQLLALARAQADEREPQPVDLSGVAREVLAEQVARAEAGGVDLGLDVRDEPRIAGSADLLRLILRNAVENAIRHTPRGGEVTLHIRAEEGDALVEVADTGPGIPAEERERVFQPFHRGTDARGEGSGLGLAIARDAAARLGGRLSLAERAQGSGLVLRYRQRRI